MAAGLQDLKFTRRINAIQFSWAISRVNIRFKINVSEFISVFMISVDLIDQNSPISVFLISYSYRLSEWLVGGVSLSFTLVYSK
jgi:hypothetical protein